ncbi:alpha/beta hydrolase [Nocardia bhagyanarayanae]|uniref:Alpha-beta hydrolase superfamily lysophospholipase n=1 Tax=Nocardia bhagyanarayanae TaxID=1215925 RepID=A0A543FF31_9NOCA|nr:alpha/beta hydrolase [Nocardia bhagyanarayanae]TQM32372.1 alpha-beta hydrolase superfamily lysophospholipase [Nocardia bhagyanarayanae]
MSERPRWYRDQQAWRDLQQFLPQRLRLTGDTEPAEEYWDWRGHHVHLDRYPLPGAPAKIVLHHGVGTNGRQMSLVAGATLAQRGFETVALDNLGYGLTQVADGTAPGYHDWIQLTTDFLAYESTRDDRPIVLYGLSAGGMLTYHVAAHAPRGTLRGIIGTTFLDPRDKTVWRAVSHDPFHATFGTAVFNFLARTPLRGVRYPMSAASKMSALCNNPDAMKVFLRDNTSAGSWVSARFFSEFGAYAPDIEPADFDVCPVLHTQPAEDHWTPLELSKPVTGAITKVPVTTVVLDNAGHYPLEEPGLTQMHDAITEFVTKDTR